jgi:hypothetical protein
VLKKLSCHLPNTDILHRLVFSRDGTLPESCPREVVDAGHLLSQV